MGISRTGIKAKLFYCLGFLIVVAIANSLHSVESVRAVRNDLTQEIGRSSAMLDDARQITTAIANMRSSLRGVTLFSLKENPAQLSKAQAAFARSASDLRDTVQHIGSNTLADIDRTAINEITTDLNGWVGHFKEFSELCASGHVDEANESALKNMTPLMEQLQKNAAALAERSKLRQEDAVKRVEATIQRTELLNLLLGVVVLLAGGLSGLLITRLVESLKVIVHSVASGAEQVASISTQVASSSQSLAQGASQQAASLEETSASTQEVNAESQKNMEVAAALGSTMAAAVPLVRRVNESLNGLANSVGKLSGSSQKIASVVKVIDGIAFQTNILALNAAVEAARGGEAGLGFAVVADEVRNLAQRSAQAAKETQGLIEESVDLVSKSAAQLADLLKASEENGVHAGRVKELVDVVTTGNERLARGITGIAGAVPHLEQATQQVAANAEESAAASEELSSEAESLRRIAKDLSVIVAGSSAIFA